MEAASVFDGDDVVHEEWVFTEDESYGVDVRDEGTIDNWVRRHPDMVRLTGRHPFNSEAPLPKLMSHGFITPASIHYVRNHGSVPKAVWEDWKVEVCGMVKKPMIFTMRDLVRLPWREIPVTLVCAGNRRKEQNMVKQTIGFNWGAAGVSTSVWRGAPLCEILRICGIMKGAKFVCFEGADDGLPKAGGLGYGTCISIGRGIDETQDILVAYLQNGKELLPDHGFPVRMIIPGFIGGRMVKWLCKIEVSSKESNNYYHYGDNKVFPSYVSAETADAQGWWYMPQYLINELNINSVITTPAHGETLQITPLSPYRIHGYAYSGGGRKVTRVEITIDRGKTWMLCELNHPENPTKYGKHWCWCFWGVEVEVLSLFGTPEIAVRAWDESMNTQPRDLIWNLMGMMNNCWFTVKITPCKGNLGGATVAFEHPTRPANQAGGWMVKQEQVNSSRQPKIAKSISSPFSNQEMSGIIVNDVRKHNKRESAWIIVNNNVYDCTSFLNDHPGGVDSILINAGSDCTEEFEAIHSSKAKLLLEDFKIGELLTRDSETSPDSSLHDGNRAISALLPVIEELALNPKVNISCKLIKKEIISYDLRKFTFMLPRRDQVLGLPVGKHIMISTVIDGKLCMRAYTPISSDEDDGKFVLVVRIYYKGVHPAFPDGGLMTQHLDSLKEHDVVGVKGPIGHIHYQGNGCFTVNGKLRAASKFAMLAGGTGITPIYQVIKAILKDPNDKSEVYLIFANRSEKDIILRDELNQWQEFSNFHLWYVLSRPSNPGEWPYSTGFITEEIAQKHLPMGSKDSVAFMCGPPSMIDFACLPSLMKLGYDKDSCYKF